MNILLIDDDYRMYEAILRDLDAEMYFAATEAEAMKQIATRDFDGILMDGDLGDGERKGFEIVKDLRVAGIKMKIIMFSSSSHYNEAGMQAGASGVFNKWSLANDEWEKTLLGLFE
jgi:DNA-binding response OmpR family regulator